MRVIAGSAKGRRLKSPPSTTRPFTDRAKEGVFSSIAGRIAGSRVLDLFAGSGSLAIEALSRGAASAVLVERDRRAVAVIRTNLDACGLEADVVVGELPAALPAPVPGAEWDLVFVDPPYAQSTEEVLALVSAVALRLSGEATVILHRRAGDGEDLTTAGLRIEDDRVYGDSRVVRYRPETEEIVT